MDVGVSHMSAEPSLTPINYAQQAPRSRRLLRRFWLPTILLLFLTSAYWWGPPLWYRVQLAYWYDRCVGHAAPPDTIVAETGSVAGGFASSPGTPYVPPEWQRFYAKLSSPGFRSSGTAFLGGRRTPEGREMLVAVDLIQHSPWAPAAERAVAPFHVRAFTHAGLPNRPQQILDARIVVPLGPSRLRLLAGQPDPKDPTHFTIRYETVDGLHAGTIDGWVRKNGVQLEPAPPVTQPLNRPLRASPD